MSIGTYDYNGLCKAFINQSQSCGKTAEGRMSFNHLSIYSYSSLLATLDPATRTLLLDKSISTYSNTSHRHTKFLLEAGSHLTVYRIALDKSHEENLAAYLDNILAGIRLYKRARQRKPYYKEAIFDTFKEFQSYLVYAGLDRRTKAYKRISKQSSKIFETLLENKLL